MMIMMGSSKGDGRKKIEETFPTATAADCPKPSNASTRKKRRAALGKINEGEDDHHILLFLALFIHFKSLLTEDYYLKMIANYLISSRFTYGSYDRRKAVLLKTILSWFILAPYF